MKLLAAGLGEDVGATACADEGDDRGPRPGFGAVVGPASTGQTGPVVDLRVMPTSA